MGRLLLKFGSETQTSTRKHIKKAWSTTNEISQTTLWTFIMRLYFIHKNNNNSNDDDRKVRSYQYNERYRGRNDKCMPNE
jgi:hypothetical protein